MCLNARSAKASCLIFFAAYLSQLHCSDLIALQSVVAGVRFFIILFILYDMESTATPESGTKMGRCVVSSMHSASAGMEPVRRYGGWTIRCWYSCCCCCCRVVAWSAATYRWALSCCASASTKPFVVSCLGDEERVQ